MSRSRQSTGALLLTALLALGVSAGPAAAESSDPPDTSRPVPTDTATPEPPTPEPPAPEPVPEPPAPEPTPAPPEPAPTAPTPPGPVEPPTPAAPQAGVDLRIAVVFDKPAYYAHEQIIARATVTNVGTATATGVVVSSSGNLDNDYWIGLTPPGVTLAPGESAEGRVEGFARTPRGDVIRLVVSTTSNEPEATPEDNGRTLSAPLSVLRGDYSGVVYGDRDGSGAFEPGEALAGLEITLSGGEPYSTYTVTTDRNGRFEARGLPAGFYAADFGSDDWWFPPTGFRIDVTPLPEVLIRAAHKIAGQLTATAVFTRPAYAVDDAAVMAVTLTNSGEAAIPGIRAYCESPMGVPAGTGELGDEPGATLPARTTRVYDIAYRVTAYAERAGYMEVRCTIGAPPVVNGSVLAQAVARVPGAHADRAAGLLVRLLPRDDQCGRCPPRRAPVPGVKVYLRSQLTGQVVARSVSAADGYFEFLDLPADLYDFGVVGPWKAPATFGVSAGDNGASPAYVHVEAGPDQPDPDGGSPPGGAPAPPGDGPGTSGAADALARTGVGVGRLALSGLLSLVAGVALVIRAGRRA